MALAAKPRHGGRLTLTVSDAGQPVAGVIVRAAGHSAKTNHSGIARLSLGGGRARSVNVTGSKSGYTAAKVTVRLPR